MSICSHSHSSPEPGGRRYVLADVAVGLDGRVHVVGGVRPGSARMEEGRHCRHFLESIKKYMNPSFYEENVVFIECGGGRHIINALKPQLSCAI